MKLIVGLGNPGKKYVQTRHNVGFEVVDELVVSNKAQVTSSPDKKLVTCYMLPDILLAKPQAFMNNSGEAVRSLVTHYDLRVSDLYVVHDDLDIPLGEYKIQFGKGPKVHNGINSIEKHLGTYQFWRVRVGVDNRDPENRIPGDAYVLQKFTDEELRILEKVIENLKFKIKNYV